jgi:hypothetical protein
MSVNSKKIFSNCISSHGEVKQVKIVKGRGKYV